MLPLVAVFIPCIAIPVLALIGGTRLASWLGMLASLACWTVTLLVLWQGAHGVMSPAPIEALFGCVVGFVGVGASITTMVAPAVPRPRLHHAALQGVIAASLLGLYAHGAPWLWVAVEAGIVALADMSLATGLRALALKTLVLGSIGAGFALFASLLVVAAAPPLLPLALIIGLVGCALQIVAMLGLSPVPSIMAAALLNVPLLAVLRFSHLDPALGGKLLLAVALVLLLVVAFGLRRRQEQNAFWGLASLHHAGLVLFAFGLGNVAAMFAGVLHMLLTSLLKTGLFSGLSFTGGSKHLAWLRVAALFAVVGLPPSGLFVSEFMIVQQTYLLHHWLCLALALALGAYAWPLLRRAQMMAVAPTLHHLGRHNAVACVVLAVPLVCLVGVAYAMPASLAQILMQVAKPWL